MVFMLVVIIVCFFVLLVIVIVVYDMFKGNSVFLKLLIVKVVIWLVFLMF